MTSTPSQTAKIALATIAAACSNSGLLAQSDMRSLTTPKTLTFDALSMPVDRSNSPPRSSDEEGDEERMLDRQPETSLGALNNFSLQTESTEGWVVTGAPYLFLPGMKGTVSVAGTAVDMDLSFSDIFDNFDVFAVSGRVEAWKDDQWGIIFDGMYLDLDGDFPAPGPPLNANVKLTQVQIDLGLGYRVFDQDMGDDDTKKSRVVIDVIGGMRYQYFKEEITIDAFPTLGGSADWMEIFIGGRGALQFDEKWRFVVRGDASGFGIGSASDLTWNLFAGFGYQLKPTQELRMGYHIQGFDYSNGSGISEFSGDYDTQGLYLSMAFTF